MSVVSAESATVPETPSEATTATEPTCKVHDRWLPCFECTLHSIEVSLEGCSVYRLWRDPLYSTERWREWE
jgi:hypothetical protein